MANAFPDVEGGIRTYLRADSDVSAIVGSRVFFGVPKAATDAAFPLVTVSRIGGGTDDSDAPLDFALVQIDCWGTIDSSGHGDKAAATTLVNAVRSALDRMNGPTTLAGGTVGFGVQEAGVIWAPDPDNDRPRYAVTAEVTAVLIP